MHDGRGCHFGIKRAEPAAHGTDITPARHDQPDVGFVRAATQPAVEETVGHGQGRKQPTAQWPELVTSPVLGHHDHRHSLPRLYPGQVRLIPRSWSTDTWWCSLKGHVTPAAHARYPGRELSVDLPDGGQLARCLRCDAWVATAVPDSNGDPATLPRPIRGRALEELIVIRAIALERGLHVIFFLVLALGLALLEAGLPVLKQDAQLLLPLLDQTRSGQNLLSRWLNRLLELDGQHVWLLAAMALGYAALEAVECVFLWRGKRWAEYLTVVATAAFLPLEIVELINGVSVLKVLALLTNLVILAYLVWTKRLFGVRGGLASLEREMAADVDWDALHSRAPAPADSDKSAEAGHI